MSDLPQKRDTLERRLNDGWDKIEEAYDNNIDSQTLRTWEDFWLSLLKEYEAVCDALAKENANGERNH